MFSKLIEKKEKWIRMKNRVTGSERESVYKVLSDERVCTAYGKLRIAKTQTWYSVSAIKILTEIHQLKACV